MKNHLRFALACCVPLVFACSGQVRSLNEATGGASGGLGNAEGGSEDTGGTSATGGTLSTGSTPSSGGNRATGGAATTGGAPSSGGAATSGGTSATGGAPGRCSSVTGKGCPSGFVCADDNDNCDARLATDCPGHCVEPLHEPPCGVVSRLDACPEGLSCVANPQSDSASNGICVGDSALNSCSFFPGRPCAEGFECLGGGIAFDGPGHCSPNGVSCMGPVTCPALPGLCPRGYTHSTIDSCFGPCVPIDTCGCHTDSECPATSVCDRLTGRCARLPQPPFTPPALCSQPFEVGICDAALPRYAFVDGACVQRTYGGCGGNENNFRTLEECLATCEGRPAANSCPEGRAPANLCFNCGPAGGCADQRTVCAQVCLADSDCTGSLSECMNGFCRPPGCE